MQPDIKITEAEWEVMKVLWKESPLIAQEVSDRLFRKTRWHYKTVKTLINRLTRKGALGYVKRGRTHHFQPLVRESECVLAESQSFLDRLFGGSLQPMVANLMKEKRLSPSDIKELQEILKGKEKS